MKKMMVYACMAAGLAVAATATTVAPAQGAGATTSRCGFYLVQPPVGEVTAQYQHCADSFILIKYHWSQGSTGRKCVDPWENVSFYRDGPHVVVDAYYVPVRPNLLTFNGKLVCSLDQPEV